MRTTRQILATGLLAAALLVAPLGLAGGSNGSWPTLAGPSAYAAPVDPDPKPKSIGQLLDEGYQCWPVADGVVRCYRGQDSPKYECRQGVCTPVQNRREPVRGTWEVQIYSLDSQTSQATR